MVDRLAEFLLKLGLKTRVKKNVADCRRRILMFMKVKGSYPIKSGTRVGDQRLRVSVTPPSPVRRAKHVSCQYS